MTNKPQTETSLDFNNMDIKIPTQIYVLKQTTKDLLKAFGQITMDDVLIDNIDIWFYNADLFEQDLPEQFKILEPFIYRTNLVRS